MPTTRDRQKVLQIALRATDQMSPVLRKAIAAITRFSSIGVAAARAVGRAMRRLARIGIGALLSPLKLVSRGFGLLKNAFSSLLSPVGLVRAAVAGLAVREMGRLITTTVAAADKIDKLSLRLGLGTKALQEYKFAASITGVEFNQLSTGLQRMTRRISEAAQGTGEAQKAIKELGLDAQALVRLAPEEQFEEIAEAMSNVSSQADKIRIAFKLFDTEGVALLQTLSLTKDQLQDLRQQAQDLGLVLSREQINRLTALKDAFTAFGGSLAGFKNRIVTEIAPALTTVFNKLAEGISKVSKRVQLILRLLVNALDPNSPIFEEVRMGLVDIGRLILSTSISIGKSIIKGLGITLVEGFRRLAPIIFRTARDFIGLQILGGVNVVLQRLEDVTGGFIENLADDALETFKEKTQSIQEIGEEIGDALAQTARIAAQQVGEPANEFTSTLTLIGGRLDELIGLLDVLEDEAKETGEVAVQAVGDAEKKLSSLEQFFKAILPTIANATGQLFGSFVDGTTRAADAFKEFTRSILTDIGRILGRLAALSLVGAFFPGVNINAIAGGGAFAKGGAFSGGRQVQFAQAGMVLPGPTLFSTRSGPVVGGELGAQSEALVPLGRTRSGELGVKVADRGGGGGGVTLVVNQTNNIRALDPRGVREVLAQQSRFLGDVVKQRIVEDSALRQQIRQL